MPELEYFLVCESLSVDRDTNRISLFNIIEDVRCVGPQDRVPRLSQMFAVACLNRTAGDEAKDFQAVFRIERPEEDLQEYRMNFRMDRPRIRLTLGIQILPAGTGRPGNLTFVFSVDDNELAHHTIMVYPQNDGQE